MAFKLCNDSLVQTNMVETSQRQIYTQKRRANEVDGVLICSPWFYFLSEQPHLYSTIQRDKAGWKPRAILTE